MRYSIIILLDEEAFGFKEYVHTLYDFFVQRGDPFEIIIMALGTEKFARIELEELYRIGISVRCFSMAAHTSAAAAVRAAIREASGQIFLICGSYLQISLEGLVALLKVLQKGIDLSIPWRQNRVDPWFNRLQSRIFNYLARFASGSCLHDLSSIVRVCRREVLEEVDFYGHLYRFLPILAIRKGFRVCEVPCDHREERGKKGFYTLRQYIGRLLDILVVFFNTRFTRKPFRFFSLLGMVFILLGIIIVIYVFYQKIFLGYPIGGRPVLLLAILAAVLGVQTSSFGLLGEILVFIHGRHKREYVIDKVL